MQWILYLYKKTLGLTVERFIYSIVAISLCGMWLESRGLEVDVEYRGVEYRGPVDS